MDGIREREERQRYVEEEKDGGTGTCYVGGRGSRQGKSKDGLKANELVAAEMHLT